MGMCGSGKGMGASRTGGMFSWFSRCAPSVGGKGGRGQRDGCREGAVGG
jgi:hypothetical protein